MIMLGSTRNTVLRACALSVLSYGLLSAASYLAQLLQESEQTAVAPEFNRAAPDVSRVRLDTSQGAILIELRREWSPHGVDRFYNLVRAGYYDNNRFFRVIEDRWAQFGINGDPAIAQVWRTQTIPDDPRRASNTRGTVAFAFAVPNGRATQIFINLRDNSTAHDAEPFVPIGRVIEGMDVADRLYSDYGETAGGGIEPANRTSYSRVATRTFKKTFLSWTGSGRP
jgi:peptidyl-prolyl cis-trans isomerase A (cyclophilin A)